jgi:hypothetical protein
MPAPVAVPRSIVLLYRAAAISNFIVTVPAFVAYDWYIGLFHLPTPPNYPFLIWIWSGMAFLWGVMFWEIARDPVAKFAMLKYTYLEKMITSTSVTVGFLAHNVPLQAWLGVLYTDVLWVLPFILAHRKMTALLIRHPTSGVASS